MMRRTTELNGRCDNIGALNAYVTIDRAQIKLLRVTNVFERETRRRQGEFHEKTRRNKNEMIKAERNIALVRRSDGWMDGWMDGLCTDYCTATKWSQVTAARGCRIVNRHKTRNCWCVRSVNDVS
uniref:Uncharacterized protein n=1 Tax=Syphacia muris TaxID=451379 RepID=A0A0N5AER6_9BILA